MDRTTHVRQVEVSDFLRLRPGARSFPSHRFAAQAESQILNAGPSL